MKRIAWVLLAQIAVCVPAGAQTIDDGIMMSQRSLQAGYVYAHDSWDEYWEGPLKRTNGNIGTITTEANVFPVAYGLFNRVTLLGKVPYVVTNPSQGVLAGQKGLQDLFFGGKVSVFERSPAKSGLLRFIAAASATIPLTDYNPDFAPLSIGTQSRRLSGRATVNYQTDIGLYGTGTTSYTIRSDVTLDRPYYFTDGHLFLTDQVEMPDVSDYAIAVGYLKHDLNTNISYTRQTTQGGGDIRRQDAPFLSNRQNFSKIGGMAMYPIPKVPIVAAYFSYQHTLDGRNVGRSDTYAVGFFYSYANKGRLIR